MKYHSCQSSNCKQQQDEPYLVHSCIRITIFSHGLFLYVNILQFHQQKGILSISLLLFACFAI